MSIIWKTQKAVYEKLTADTTLMAMIHGVYDHVPDRSEFPYVTIGEIRAVNNSVKGAIGYQLDLNINAYSKDKGRKEVLEIMERVRELLDEQSFSVSGANHISTRFISKGTSLLRDGITYQGREFFRVVMFS